MGTTAKPSISDAEWRLLEVLWTQHPATAEDVVARLADKADWHARTVKTMLHRLVRKGVLRFEKDGKRYLYTPALQRRQCVREASRSFLARVFGGAAAPAIVHMLEDSRLSQQEIAQLRQVLDEKVGSAKKASK